MKTVLTDPLPPILGDIERDGGHPQTPANPPQADTPFGIPIFMLHGAGGKPSMMNFP